jgi:8-oxo-dGTP pyrophosphatase MutT (NUDIX family)
MSSSSKLAPAKRVQYGALPYRLSAGSRPQFMLVTSRETRRWIIPKGWPKKGKLPHHSAAREAFEEAGVVGAVAKRSIGSFSYEKRLKNGGAVVCNVRVFPLQVRRQNKQWPEKQERIVKWLSASQAAEKVKEPMLGEIIRRLARRYG